MRDLIRKPKVAFLIFLLILGAVFLISNGLKYGLDFSGGTQFTIELSKEINDPVKMEAVVSTISQRLDWSGLKDTTVNAWGNKYVVAQVGTTDPKEVEAIESILYKQGKFENIMNGEVLFEGKDVLTVEKSASKGYSIRPVGSNLYEWSLPFTLKAKSARRFSEKVFHVCRPNGSSYDCPKTYFFIDRPKNALIIINPELYKDEEVVPADPLNEQSQLVNFDEITSNANVPYIIADSIDENTLEKIKDYNVENIIVPANTFDTSLLKDKYKVIEVAKKPDEPWIWTATGLKSIIWINQDITNQDAPTKESSNFKVFYTLLIRGSAKNKEEAIQKSNEIFVILSAGSLPVAVENISKESISPLLGKNFLKLAMIIGLIAVIVVSLVLYFRYRLLLLTVAMMFSTLSEVFLILVLASLIGWRLDLAALVGLIAAIGTGVDDYVIITDEVSKEKDKAEERSLVAKIKNAFFMIFAAATTTIAAMLPILMFGLGFGKLTGFALTIISGVLIGVIITRPAYSEIAKYIMAHYSQKNTKAKK